MDRRGEGKFCEVTKNMIVIILRQNHFLQVEYFDQLRDKYHQVKEKVDIYSRKCSHLEERLRTLNSMSSNQSWQKLDHRQSSPPYLIFVTSTTSGARVNFFWPMQIFTDLTRKIGIFDRFYAKSGIFYRFNAQNWRFSV